MTCLKKIQLVSVAEPGCQLRQCGSRAHGFNYYAPKGVSYWKCFFVSPGAKQMSGLTQRTSQSEQITPNVLIANVINIKHG